MIEETLKNARARKRGVLRLIIDKDCNLSGEILDQEIANSYDYTRFVQPELNTYHGQILHSGLQSLFGDIDIFIKSHYNEKIPTVMYNNKEQPRFVNAEELEQKYREERRQKRVNYYHSSFTKAQEIYSNNQSLLSLKRLNNVAKFINGCLTVNGGRLVREYDTEISEMEEAKRLKERAERLNTSGYFVNRTNNLKEKIYSVLKLTKKRQI